MDNGDLLCMPCSSHCYKMNFIWPGGKCHIHGTAGAFQKDMDYWEQRKYYFLLAQYCIKILVVFLSHPQNHLVLHHIFWGYIFLFLF